MKKIILSIPLAAILLVSCKKDYTCTCTDTYTYNGETEVETYTYYIKGATKKQAHTSCETTVSYQDDSGDESEKTACELSK